MRTPRASAGTASAKRAHSSAARPKVAGMGSYFDVQDASGDTYRVTLVKIIDPAQGADQFNTPDSGKRFVGVVFTIKALNGSPQNEDANDDAAVRLDHLDANYRRDAARYQTAQPSACADAWPGQP
jgi:hypothetical protein